METEYVGGAHDGGVLVVGADAVEAGAEVFEGVGEVGAGFTVDAHANANAGLQISRNVCGSASEAAVREWVPAHGGVRLRSGRDDGCVGVDEVAEDELVGEEVALDEPRPYLVAVLDLSLG